MQRVVGRQLQPIPVIGGEYFQAQDARNNFQNLSVKAALADGSLIEAEICSSVFYDPKGDRQNV